MHAAGTIIPIEDMVDEFIGTVDAPPPVALRAVDEDLRHASTERENMIGQRWRRRKTSTTTYLCAAYLCAVIASVSKTQNTRSRASCLLALRPPTFLLQQAKAEASEVW